MRIILFLMLISVVAHAEIIPTYRRTTWQDRVGVPGGIPRRSTTNAVLTSGASNTAIQNALNACPSNQVVYLEPGTYDVTGVVIPNGVTLRGGGTNTVINAATGASDSSPIFFGERSHNGWPEFPTTTSVSSGSTDGSVSIVVASASGFAVGGMFLINELNDTNFVTNFGENFSGDLIANQCGQCDDGWGSQTRLRGQVCEITNISGTTIGFQPPLFKGYSLTPQAYPYTVQARMASLEDLKIVGTDHGFTEHIAMSRVNHCWVSGIWSDTPDGDHVWMSWAFRCEIRDSMFHNALWHGPGVTDATVKLNWKSTACLIENNIMWRCHTSVMLNYGCAGNVIAYNYSTNSYHHNDVEANLEWMIQDFSYHNAHAQFNLFEGNIGTQYHPDSLHGSSSHNTALRNRFMGRNYYCPPLNSNGALDCASGFYETDNEAATTFAPTTSTNNLVGNILGYSGMSGTYLITADDGWNNAEEPYTWVFGIEGSHDNTADCQWGQDRPFTSVLMHGNYAYTTNDIQWDSGIADHDIPQSYYLTGKPAWWGCAQTWPYVDPTSPSTFSITNLPAAHRFYYGTNAPTNGCAGAVSPRNPPRIRGIKIRRS